MPTDRKKLDEMEQRSNSAFNQHAREVLSEVMANMEAGEYFIYGFDYHQHLIVREEEMPLVVAYQGELHVSDTDHMQIAYDLLNQIHDNGVNGNFTVSYDLFMKIAKLVDPKGHVDTGKPLDDMSGPDTSDWMSEDNIRKLKETVMPDTIDLDELIRRLQEIRKIRGSIPVLVAVGEGDTRPLTTLCGVAGHPGYVELAAIERTEKSFKK